MREHRIIKLLLVVFVLLPGCYYDVEEELYPTIECLTMDMSYEEDILPIIDGKCYSCHNAEANFGNVNLEGHQALSKYAEDGSLLGVVKHSSGYSPMPKNQAKLLDCEIEKIEAWIADGALNN